MTYEVPGGRKKRSAGENALPGEQLTSIIRICISDSDEHCRSGADSAGAQDEESIPPTVEDDDGK